MYSVDPPILVPRKKQRNCSLHKIGHMLILALAYTLLILAAFSAVQVSAQIADSDDYRDPDAEQDALLQNGRGRARPVTTVYDPASRDFTARCLRLAQYSGPKACEIFNACCSEENVLNKLNGDRCQRGDPANGCTPNFQGDGVQWSQCKAYNCTQEITTTTTTTVASPLSMAVSPFSGTILTNAFTMAAVALMFQFRRIIS
ncbi:hypothetical protein DdX_13620 [Ditylenchus destructor]|uniref:Uncharacterized protein n=1 Tax=Ditylenchus destructor TaxID=166010 RepID=A0AAD4R2Q3_9BILA|nr:hypothetical protein DdX_13620 [Ditylenchus destructor]